MANSKKKLGKGLSAIISSSASPAGEIERLITERAGEIYELEVGKITPNPDQPRLHFDESEINGLAESIKAVGLIQPIIVRKDRGAYFVVAGERRLRAVKSAGMKKIKAIITTADDEANLSIALIENIQRSDLNPIEEAQAYRALINKFRLKQNEVAEKVGKDRASVANSLRLLNLPQEIQRGLIEGRIKSGHAKVLLSLPGRDEQMEFYNTVVSLDLSVRALEKLISTGSEKKSGVTAGKARDRAHVRKMEEKLQTALGTKVEIKHSGGRGRIEISYYSLDDFDRITEIIIK